MGDLTIYVLDRGWVIIGCAQQDPNDFLRLRLTNSATVRRWGTSKGLGELAERGPLSDTVLEPNQHDIHINKRYVMMEIPCSAKGWKSWLK